MKFLTESNHQGLVQLNQIDDEPTKASNEIQQILNIHNEEVRDINNNNNG